MRRAASAVRTTAVFALAFALIATASLLPPHHGHHLAPHFSATVSSVSVDSVSASPGLSSLPRPPRPKFAHSPRPGDSVPLDENPRADVASWVARFVSDPRAAATDLHRHEGSSALLVYASNASRTRGQPQAT